MSLTLSWLLLLLVMHSHSATEGGSVQWGGKPKRERALESDSCGEHGVVWPPTLWPWSLTKVLWGRGQREPQRGSFPNSGVSQHRWLAGERLWDPSARQRVLREVTGVWTEVWSKTAQVTWKQEQHWGHQRGVFPKSLQKWESHLTQSMTQRGSGEKFSSLGRPGAQEERAHLRQLRPVASTALTDLRPAEPRTLARPLCGPLGVSSCSPKSSVCLVSLFTCQELGYIDDAHTFFWRMAISWINAKRTESSAGFLMWLEQHRIIRDKGMNGAVLSVPPPAGT